MNRELYDEAIRSNILSRKLIEQLMESMNYRDVYKRQVYSIVAELTLNILF